MADTGIIRPQTEQERLDFIDIQTKDPIRMTGDTLRAKIDLINRQRIIQAKPATLDAELNKLACSKCFQVEYNRGRTAGRDLREEYQRYSGRLKLDSVYYHQHKRARGDLTDFSVALRFRQCEYCGGSQSICFTDSELDKPLFDALKKKSFEYSNLELLNAVDKK